MSVELLLVDMNGLARGEGRRVAIALAERHPGGRYSWSRSGDVGVFAWCDDGAIGVDVERLRDVQDWPRIAAEFFDAGTRAAIWRASDPLAAFYDAWTILEARGKAVGVGLSAPAPSLPVTSFRFEHRGAPFVASVARNGIVPAPRWAEAD